MLLGVEQPVIMTVNEC